MTPQPLPKLSQALAQKAVTNGVQIIRPIPKYAASSNGIKSVNKTVLKTAPAQRINDYSNLIIETN